MLMPVRNYSELIFWQKAVDLVVEVYRAVRNFPREEVYGLTSQLKRAAVSIPSNIAEGQGRRTSKDFIHFLFVANGSSREVETQTIIARRLGYLNEEVERQLLSRCAEVGKILYGLINSLES